MHDVVLALALGEIDPRDAFRLGELVHRPVNRSVIRASGAVDAIGSPSCRWTYPTKPAAYCNLG